MIVTLNPYPSYKDSGVPWMGQVPEHWQVRRLKTLCTRSALYGANMAATSYTSSGVRFLRTTDITDDGDLKKGGVFLPSDLVDDYLLSDGDVLISRSGTIGRSFLYDSDLHGPCAYAGYLVRFVPSSQVLPEFVFFFTKTQAFAAFLRVMAISSTIENVNGEKYANAPIPLPPLPEQTAICRYLGHVDRRIRRNILAKLKLIRLLEEQRQLSNLEAVTGRLDVRSGRPYPAYKESGVEWLEQVPEHWEMVPNRALLRLRKEVVGGDSSSHMLLSLTKQGVIPRDLENPEGKFPSSFDTYQVVEPGDFIFCLFDIDETPRAVGLSTMAGMVTGAYTRFECIDQHAAEFVFAYYLAMDNGKRLKPLYTGLRKVITKSRFLSAKMPLPPVSERNSILEYIRKVSKQTDATIERTEQEISLLRQYRARIIADVATGKLDSRDAASNLPEESVELGPLEDEGMLLDATELSADVDLEPVLQEVEA